VITVFAVELMYSAPREFAFSRVFPSGPVKMFATVLLTVKEECSPNSTMTRLIILAEGGCNIF
jgi:hypothetical protein